MQTTKNYIWMSYFLWISQKSNNGNAPTCTPINWIPSLKFPSGKPLVYKKIKIAKFMKFRLIKMQKCSAIQRYIGPRKKLLNSGIWTSLSCPLTRLDTLPCTSVRTSSKCLGLRFFDFLLEYSSCMTLVNSSIYHEPLLVTLLAGYPSPVANAIKWSAWRGR